MAAGFGLSRSKRSSDTEVVLGEDWVAPDDLVDGELRQHRARRSWISLNSSPLARKIITFNLLAMVVLVAGVLYLNPFRDSLVLQRESGLVAEARLMAEVFEAHLPADPVAGTGRGFAGRHCGQFLPASSASRAWTSMFLILRRRCWAARWACRAVTSTRSMGWALTTARPLSPTFLNRAGRPLHRSSRLVQPDAPAVGSRAEVRGALARRVGRQHACQHQTRF